MVSADDVRKLFLQAVMSRRIVTEKLARTILLKCIDAVKAIDNSAHIPYQDNSADWNAFVDNLNKSLDPLDLDLRHTMDEIRGVRVYALTNTKGDDIAQIATTYSPLEIAYFKAVVEQIVLADSQAFSVSSLAALREVTYLKSVSKASMTKSQAEVVLGSLVASGWLLKSKEHRYSLSARTILELQQYLKQTYPDEIIECTLCMEIVTRGITCSNPNCHTYLHNHCHAGLRRNRAHCPTCQKDWNPENSVNPIGEKAMRQGQDMRRKVRRRSGGVGEEEEEDDDEEDPDMTQDFSQSQAYDDEQMTQSTQAFPQTQSQSHTQTQTQRATNGKAKSRGRRKVYNSDDDEDEDHASDLEGTMNIDNLTQPATRRQTRRNR